MTCTKTHIVDEDGHCKNCGIAEEEGAAITHECPPGFQQTAPDAKPQAVPAETFPVADYLREFMRDHGWSILDVAGRGGMATSRIEGIAIHGHVIDANDAEGLARAFGTSPDLWLGLQAAELEAELRAAATTAALEAEREGLRARADKAEELLFAWAEWCAADEPWSVPEELLEKTDALLHAAPAPQEAGA